MTDALILIPAYVLDRPTHHGKVLNEYVDPKDIRRIQPWIVGDGKDVGVGSWVTLGGGQRGICSPLTVEEVKARVDAALALIGKEEIEAVQEEPEPPQWGLNFILSIASAILVAHFTLQIWDTIVRLVQYWPDMP